MPVPVAKSLAAIGIGRVLGFNRDQVIMSQEDNTCDLSKFRDEELTHRDQAVAEGAREAPAYPLLAALIRAGCRAAIKISEKVYSFDSSLLPDGSYQVKVVASDAPVHTDAEALTGEKVSEVFVVDTTPPMPGVLTATMIEHPASTA